jgi:hypothetical protein
VTIITAVEFVEELFLNRRETKSITCDIAVNTFLWYTRYGEDEEIGYKKKRGRWKLISIGMGAG